MTRCRGNNTRWPPNTINEKAYNCKAIACRLNISFTVTVSTNMMLS